MDVLEMWVSQGFDNWHRLLEIPNDFLQVRDGRARRKIPLALQNSFGDLSALALNGVDIDVFKGLSLPDFHVLLPELDGPPQSGPVHQSGPRFLNISKSINGAHIQRFLVILDSSFIVIDLAELLLDDV